MKIIHSYGDPTNVYLEDELCDVLTEDSSCRICTCYMRMLSSQMMKVEKLNSLNEFYELKLGWGKYMFLV